MMDSLSIGIVEVLKQGNNYTSEQLGKIFSVSEKTIRNRIKEINEEIINHGAVIDSQRGKGFTLDIINSSLIDEWLTKQHDDNSLFPSTPEERMLFIVEYLLKQKDYVYIDDLCNILFVARNTMSQDIKKVEQVLHKYNLAIDRRPNYGIKISGKEINKRLCIIDYLNNKQHNDKLNKVSQIMVFGDTLSQEFYKAEFVTSVENYLAIKNVLFVTYSRLKDGFEIDFDKKYEKELKDSIQKEILDIVDNIVKDLKKDYSILDNPSEKLYLALQIAGRGNIKNNSSAKTNTNIDEIVQNMLLEIKNGLKVDFTNDFDLIMSLKHHMTAFDIRMKYYIPVENPILDVIKKNYSLAYALASYSCNYLSEYYDKPIKEDEIGFIAVIYALALDRKNKPIKKKNVVIVCASGNATSKFFVHRYKELFKDYLGNVYECSGKDITNFDFIGKKIDYCFTTIDTLFNLPVPCYKISLFPSESEIEEFKGIFASTDKDELLKYYNERLFIPHLKAKNKKDAIKKMINHINDEYDIPDNFYDLIMQREKYGLTSFGNMVAIPHPSIICTIENIVCVAILDEPINWGSNDVQLILLLSLSTDENQDTSTFIEATSGFISDENAVKDLVKNPTFENLINKVSRKH